MITRAQIAALARYNHWQNDNLYDTAESLSDAQRREDGGAFFGSIHATLAHILWADRVWMSRFDGQPAPSGKFEGDWAELRREREAMDALFLDWADRVDEAWLALDYRWHSGVMGREVTQPTWILVTHMFNHQTHHRGQVHALLTRFGVRPGDTDLCFMGL